MKELESILHPISSNFVLLTRNPMRGWFELQIGIPNNWAFSANDEIDVEIINETEVGKVIKIFPKNDNLVVDDLVLFAEIIINTNKKIFMLLPIFPSLISPHARYRGPPKFFTSQLAE